MKQRTKRKLKAKIRNTSTHSIVIAMLLLALVGVALLGHILYSVFIL